MNRDKIIILIQNFNSSGGTEIAARNLSMALNECNLETSILAVEDYSGQNLNVRSLSELGMMPKPKTTIEKILGSDRYEKKLAETIFDYCRKEGIETIINFTYENLRILPKDPGIKTIGVYHWSVIGYEKSLMAIVAHKHFFSRLVSSYLLKRDYARLHRHIAATDYAIALTDNGRQELMQLAPDSTPIVIPNFLTQKSPKSVDFSLKNKKKAVFVGRLSKEKGVFYLLDIWEKIIKEIPDARLEIYGQGPEESEMKLQISNRKIKGIRFQGFESNPEKIYSDADVLLCTSETEGFGMVLIEAMNYGVVPFAFDCPVSPKELISESGKCAKCFDTSDYAANVISVWQNAEDMPLLATRAFERSLNFKKDHIIQKWVQLIQETNTL